MAAEGLVVLAGQVGAHALPLFLALLAALLILVAASWWALRTHVLPRAQSRLPQTSILLLNGLVGFAFVISAAALFAEIADELGADGVMSLADEALTASLRTHISATTLRVFAAITYFGDPRALTVLGIAVALLLWLLRKPTLALGWMLALGGNALLNPMLKRVFGRIRPLHEHGVVSELGWSFPSGHTSSSTVAYGMLAYLAVRTLPKAWHLPAVLGATALVFTVGCSRIFLQVHFASDVAAGFASGSAWLAVCIVSVELSRTYGRRL
ncbi:MAG: phosphatase PAP2 family protein [Burkholderiales bacterium]